MEPKLLILYATPRESEWLVRVHRDWGEGWARAVIRRPQPGLWMPAGSAWYPQTALYVQALSPQTALPSFIIQPEIHCVSGPWVRVEVRLGVTKASKGEGTKIFPLPTLRSNARNQGPYKWGKKKTVTGNMKEQKICYSAHTALSCPRAPRTIVCVLR